MDAGILQTEALQTIWTDVVWVGALAATPVALVAALICSTRRIRPATRHAVALAALLSFVTSAIGGAWWRPDWLGMARHAVPASATTTPERNVIAPDPVWPPATPEPALIARADPSADPLSDPCKESDADCDLASDGLAFNIDDAAACDDEEEAVERTVTKKFAAAPIGAHAPRHAASHTESPASSEKASAPVPSRTPAPVPTAAPRRAEPVVPFIDRAVALRDAIAAIPPLPLVVWLFGAGVLLSIAVVRTIRARRVIRTARAAPREIVAAVADASTALGLQRPPTTLVTEARISPMVWCGLTPQLIIPLELWRSLDDDSRRAVLVHELAHVRRGDHRWCWLAALVHAAYWWHPLVWWLGRKLRDDAELCCDAWVTALLPRSRRAYAEALLAATEFLSLQPGTRRASAMSLGVVPVNRSSRPSRKLAQRLARRITMVMTDRTAPRLSVLGALLVVAGLGVGAFVTPGLACPPEKQSEQPVRVLVPGHGVVVQPKMGQPVARQPKFQFSGEAPAIEAMAGQGAAGAAAQDKAVYEWRVAQEAAAAAAANGSAQQQQGQMTRSYHLPDGKLEALIELMSRQDVPIFIEAHEDHIVVYGTPQQQEIFGAFVQLINPGAQQRSPDAPAAVKERTKDKAKKEREMMKRRAGAETEEMRYREALEKLQRSHSDAAAQAEQVRVAAEAARERAEAVRGLMETMRDQVSDTQDEAAAQAVHSAMRALESRANVLARDADQKVSSLSSLERRMEQLEAQLRDTEDHLDRLTEMLQSLNDQDGTEDGEDEAPEADSGTDVATNGSVAFHPYLVNGGQTDQQALTFPTLVRALQAPLSVTAPAPTTLNLVPARAPLGTTTVTMPAFAPYAASAPATPSPVAPCPAQPAPCTSPTPAATPTPATR